MTTRYQTDWHHHSFRQVRCSAYSPDKEELLDWIDGKMASYPPEGYSTEATVSPTMDGWMATVTRSTHCE